MLDAPRNANSKTQMGGGGEATGQNTQDPPLTASEKGHKDEET